MAASSAITTKKRKLDDDVNPPKKRKLNEENDTSCAPVSVATVVATMTAAADLNAEHKEENDNPAKVDAAATKDDSATTAGNGTNANAVASNWSFEASDFSFGDTSWVKQTSNTDTTETSANDKPAPTTTSANSTGLGFQKALADNKDEVETSKSDADKHNDSKKTPGGAEAEARPDPDTKTTESTSSWADAWAKTNADGTFKLTFDWGKWENPNSTIDLNPNSKVGWESQAVTYDPNSFDPDESTQNIVQQMAGEQDTGDTTDDVQFTLNCKVFNLLNGAYVERGRGEVQVNTYKLDKATDTKTEESTAGIRARLLCRRDTVLTTLINAPILKSTVFEKVGNFIRFGVVELCPKLDAKKNDNDEDKDNEQQGEDDDLKTQVNTYLLKPIIKTEIDVFLKKIKEIQNMM